jgi:hypothetical protein
VIWDLAVECSALLDGRAYIAPSPRPPLAQLKKNGPNGQIRKSPPPPPSSSSPRPQAICTIHVLSLAYLAEKISPKRGRREKQRMAHLFWLLLRST